MRGWTLGPVGAVIVVLLLGACGYLILARGGGKSDEELIRAYYRDQGASGQFAEGIEVGGCRSTNQSFRSTLVYRCQVRIAGREVPGTCFAIDDGEEKVVAGPQQLPTSFAGCRRVSVNLEPN